MTLPDRTAILELAGTLASARPDTRHEDMQRAAQVIRDQLREIDRLNAELSEARAQWDMWADRAMNELGENLTNRAALKGSQE